MLIEPLARAFVTLVSAAMLIACAPRPVPSQPALAPRCEGRAPSCRVGVVGAMCSDVGVAAECTARGWQCPSHNGVPMITAEQCGCSGPPRRGCVCDHGWRCPERPLAERPVSEQLAPGSTTCTGDGQCALFVSDRCDMFAVRSDARDRPPLSLHQRCLRPSAIGCECAIPGIEVRCDSGRCEHRIMGATRWIRAPSGG
jgi:hypothetical protein